MRNVSHDSGSGEDTEIEKTYTKGPWTLEEDNLLLGYIDKHGDGNWNSVHKHCGLSRCGKSCRLRWVNHLRPNLKKGAFTEIEGQRVIELHAAIGNKWSLMVKELPGRTDNEIKNFWNTRLKRLKRLGLPIYPDGVWEQAMNAAAQAALNTDSLDDHHSQESLEPVGLEIPEVDFKLLQHTQRLTYYKSVLHSLPMRGLMRQRPSFVQPNTYYNNLIASPYPPYRKQRRDPDTAFPFTGDGYAVDEQSTQLWNYPCEQFNVLPDRTCAQSDVPDGHLLFDASPFEQPNIFLDSHLLGDASPCEQFNGRTYSSPSEPFIHEAEKLGLPSFQYFDHQDEPGDWETQQYNQMPALESENTLVKSSLTDQTPHSSTFCDELLESGNKRATDTDADVQLLRSYLLGQTDITPASVNTTEHNSNFQISSSSTERRKSFFEDDWIR